MHTTRLVPACHLPLYLSCHEDRKAAAWYAAVTQPCRHAAAPAVNRRVWQCETEQGGHSLTGDGCSHMLNCGDKLGSRLVMVLDCTVQTLEAAPCVLSHAREIV